MSTEQQVMYEVEKPTISSPPQPADASVSWMLTPDRLRVWGRRAAFSLVDQGLTSGAGFAVNLLLARWILPEAYGAFAVAFAGFLFVSGFHNVLLLEPMSVFGPSRYPERLPEYFRGQLVVHMVLVGALSVITLLAGVAWWRANPASSLPNALVGAGLALPFLLLQWLVRRMCYVVQRPAMAVTGSALFVLIVAAGLFLLEHFAVLGPFSAFLLMGFGSLLASVLLAWQLGLLPREVLLRSGVSWQAIASENWTYGRWLVGSTMLSSMSNQVQTFVAAALLGLGAAGVLRAMQLPALLMIQVVAASGPIILPTFAYAFGRGNGKWVEHGAKVVSVALGTGAFSFALLLFFFSTAAERVLYGGKFAAHASLIWILALIPVATGFSQGFSMALRAASRPHFDLVANLIAAPIGLVSAVVLMRLYGLIGGATSMVLSYALYCCVTWCVFDRTIWSYREVGDER